MGEHGDEVGPDQGGQLVERPERCGGRSVGAAWKTRRAAMAGQEREEDLKRGRRGSPRITGAGGRPCRSRAMGGSCEATPPDHGGLVRGGVDEAAVTHVQAHVRDALHSFAKEHQIARSRDLFPVDRCALWGSSNCRSASRGRVRFRAAGKHEADEAGAVDTQGRHASPEVGRAQQSLRGSHEVASLGAAPRRCLGGIAEDPRRLFWTKPSLAARQTHLDASGRTLASAEIPQLQPGRKGAPRALGR